MKSLFLLPLLVAGAALGQFGFNQSVGWKYMHPSTGGGSGTVTSVGSGTIGPLFSVSWATQTTTPALSLDLAAQSSHCVVWVSGGSTAVPTCSALTLDTYFGTSNGIVHRTGTNAYSASAVVDADVSFTAPALGAPTAGSLRLSGATIAADGTSPALLVTATLPTIPTADVDAARISATSAGSQSWNNSALTLSLLPGYTGGRFGAALRASNTALGTGTFNNGDQATTDPLGNYGAVINALPASGNTSAAGLISYGQSKGTGKSAGVIALAVDGNTNAASFGVIGLSSGVNHEVGGYFGNGTTTVPVMTNFAAALVANARDTTDIFDGYYSDSLKLKIDQTGAISTGSGVPLTITTTAPAQAASSTAGAAATITLGSAAVAGSTNAGAAAGGDATINCGGSAARLTSGNAAAGNCLVSLGAGVGTGASGMFRIGPAPTTAVTAADVLISGTSNTQTPLVIQAKSGADTTNQAVILENSAGNNTLDLFPGGKIRITGTAGRGITLDPINNGGITFADYRSEIYWGGQNVGLCANMDRGLGVCAVATDTTPTELLQATFCKNYQGDSSVSTQFDKTASTSLAAITGLSSTLIASRVYGFSLTLHVTADATGGEVVDMGGGSATATNFISSVRVLADTTNVYAETSRQSSPTGASAGVAGDTSYFVQIDGRIKVNGAGTLIPRFAQKVATGTSSVLVGSTMRVWDTQ